VRWRVMFRVYPFEREGRNEVVGAWFGAWPLHSPPRSYPSLCTSCRFPLARTYRFRSGSGWAPLEHTRAAFPSWDRTPTAHLARQ